MKLNTYCDSTETKELILKSHSAQSGLFFHELYMLYCVSLGWVTTTEIKQYSKFVYEFGVKYPFVLLDCLKSYGYISINDASCFWDIISYDDLRALFKYYEIKSPKTKKEMLDVAKEQFDVNTAMSVVDKCYYTLTELGKSALNEFEQWKYEDVLKGNSKAWYVLQSFSTCSTKNTDIKMFVIETICFKVDAVNKMATALSQTGAFINNGYQFSFDKPKNIVIDEKLSFSNVIKFVVLFNELKFIVFTDSEEHNTVCYDLTNYTLLFEETLLKHEILNPWTIFNVPSSFQFNENFSVLHDEYIDLYFSPSNAISEIILLEEIAKRENVKVNKVDNFFDDDTSNNYCVTTYKTNIDLIEYIMYLIIERIFLPIQIYGAPIDKVYHYLLSKNSSKTNKVCNCDYYSNFPVLETIIQKYNSGDIDSKLLITRIISKYPHKVIKADYAGYTLKNYGKYNNFYDVLYNKSAYKMLHDDIVLKLKENNKIPIKWRSEFELYLQIKKIYSQAIFQYRSDWLGLQSLDIYIPNKKIAFEYQGVQHYEAVEIFGGINALEHRKELDSQKKKLCENQGVKLIYWKHDEPIEERLIKEKLRSVMKNDK